MLDDLYYFILAVMSILVMFYNYEVPPKDKIDHGKKYRTMDEKDRKEKAVKLEVKAIRRHVTNLDTVDGFDGVKPKIVAKSAKQSLKKKTSLRLALHESNSKKKVIEEEDEVFFGGVRRNASMTTINANNPLEEIRKSSSGGSTPSSGEYDNLDELKVAMAKSGLGDMETKLVIGVDFTASNEWQGKYSFSKQSLHKLQHTRMNPYQKAIQALEHGLGDILGQNSVYAYGFGDSITRDLDIFNLFEHDRPCKDFKHVLQEYANVAKRVKLSGPTNFAPLINRAIKIAKGEEHEDAKILNHVILVILADGQVEKPKETLEAMKAASSLPISIITVGIGDGPWGSLENPSEMGSKISGRIFDNFHFAKFQQNSASLALTALSCLPFKFKEMRRHNLIRDSPLMMLEQKWRHTNEKMLIFGGNKGKRLDDSDEGDFFLSMEREENGKESIRERIRAKREKKRRQSFDEDEEEKTGIREKIRSRRERKK